MGTMSGRQLKGARQQAPAPDTAGMTKQRPSPALQQPARKGPREHAAAAALHARPRACFSSWDALPGSPIVTAFRSCRSFRLRA